MDEFGSTECVICMEVFEEGERLRKLSTCRHIFHSTCIITWFSGEQQRLSQKCPQCNLTVSLEAIKKALQELSPDKNRFSSMFNCEMSPYSSNGTNSTLLGQAVRLPPIGSPQRAAVVNSP